MANQALEFIISAKNYAQAELKKLSGQFKSMVFDFESAQSASRSFALGLAALGTAAVGAGYYFVSQAKESVKAQKQLNAVLASTNGIAGMTAEAAKNLSEEMQKVTNFDNDAVLSAENLLLTFTNIGKDVFPTATETVLNMSTALGQDLKSSAVQLGKALQDPIQGVSALSRVGVNFTDKQKQMIEQMVKSGKTMDAQKFILKELETEFGNSARAAADPMTQMKNAIGNAGEAIGMQLLPYMDQWAKAVTDFANEDLPKIIDRIKEFSKYLSEHKEILIVLSGVIVGMLIPAIIGLAGSFLTLSIALLPYMIGGAIIGGLIAGIYWIYENWDWLKQKAVEIWGIITQFLSDTWDSIKGTINTKWEEIKKYFSDTWDDIKTIIDTKLGNIKQFFSDLWISIKGTIDSVWGGIKQFFSDTWDWIKTVFDTGGNIISIAWNSLWNGLKDFVKPIFDEIIGIVQGAIGWVADLLDLLGLAGEKANKIQKDTSGGGIGGGGGQAFANGGMLDGGFRAFASGGIASAPTLGLIGEGRYNEAVVPLPDGKSIPVMMRGGGNPIITVNISGNNINSGDDMNSFGQRVTDAVARALRLSNLGVPA